MNSKKGNQSQKSVDGVTVKEVNEENKLPFSQEEIDILVQNKQLMESFSKYLKKELNKIMEKGETVEISEEFHQLLDVSNTLKKLIDEQLQKQQEVAKKVAKRIEKEGYYDNTICAISNKGDVIDLNTLNAEKDKTNKFEL